MNLERGRTHRLVFILLLMLSVAPFSTAQNGEGSAPSRATPDVPRLPNECNPVDRASAEVLQRLAAQPDAALYLRLGMEFGRKGDYRCALVSFESAVVVDPTAVEAHYDLALALIQNHQPQRAVQELQTVIQQQPNSFAAHNALGLA